MATIDTRAEKTSLASNDLLLISDSEETVGGIGISKKVKYSTIKSYLGLTKSDIGLANVDNTTDLDKPISTATQTALDLKASLSGTEVLTNKTINLTNNTLVSTVAQLNTAITDGDVLTTTGTDTLSNKTLDSTCNVSSASGQPFSFRNKLINGGFNIWQRGSSFTAAGYSADRWKIDSVTATTVSRQAFNNALGTYVLNAQPTNAANALIIAQCLEASYVNALKGKRITFSFMGNCASGTNQVTAYVQKSATADSSSASFTGAGTVFTLTTNPTKFSMSYDVPDDGTANGLRVVFVFNNAANGVANSMYQVQLEEGSIATPFEQRPISVELAMCRRYTRWVGSENGCWQTVATNFVCGINLSEPMRGAPIATLKGSVNVHEYGIAFRNVSAISTTALSAFGGYLTLTTAAANALGDMGNININGISGEGILLEAEL